VRTLAYNAAGQVSAVNDVGGSNVDHAYLYDATRRMTKATASTGGVRNFLVAPAAQRLGAGALDVEVQHLATGATNGLLAGWVYAGENPILRFEPDGFGGIQVKYYLEDASDSMAALVNAAQQKIADYRYDAFGNLLTGSAIPTGPAGGDFGFHAAWREEATGLYHMRARMYDAETGRFLTPDPAEPNPQVPETYEPYSFANNNPHLYSDPTGLFSITEISVSGHIQQNLSKFNNLAVQRARSFVIDKVQEVVAESLVDLLARLIPGFGKVDLVDLNNIEALGLSSRLGSTFQDFVQDTVCGTIGANSGIANSFCIEPIVDRDGEVVRSGLNCSNLGQIGSYLRDLTTEERFTPRPDYIINPNDPQAGGTYLIGDMTLSADGLYRKYIDPGRQQGQWQAITNHASNFGFNVSLFITFREGSDWTFRALSAKLGERSLKEGVLVYVISLIE
jgi:RHS repeat-associated protein